ncbi:hypothetical protein [Bifidobacterium cuniculi]|uniref:Uncharacterized protein n=1 Tax=Bifidobacterium cuniculi TaxID=1688 RepID=A0A087AL30_9BIFI|nr:hypothetical protein [Bifidobacterium cuniculi]KFI59480.1 hypothetical protein BCUN_1605 [Bifidobacterium cuniculi]
MIRNFFLMMIGLSTNGVPTTTVTSATTLGMVADMEDNAAATPATPLNWAA